MHSDSSSRCGTEAGDYSSQTIVWFAMDGWITAHALMSFQLFSVFFGERKGNNTLMNAFYKQEPCIISRRCDGNSYLLCSN